MHLTRTDVSTEMQALSTAQLMRMTRLQESTSQAYKWMFFALFVLLLMQFILFALLYHRLKDMVFPDLDKFNSLMNSTQSMNQ